MDVKFYCYSSKSEGLNRCLDDFAQKSSKYHPLELLLRNHGNYSKIRHKTYVIKTTITVSHTMTLLHPSFKYFKEIPASLFFSFPFQHYQQMHN